jgi:hypothetical protein
MKKTLSKKDYKYTDITKINDAKNMGRPIQFVGKVSWKEEIPFMAESEIKMSCDPDDSKAMCNKCPNAQLGACVKTVGADSNHILKFINLPHEKRGGVLRSIANVPSKCSKASFNLSGDKINLTQGLITPLMESVGTYVKDIENLHQIKVPIVFMGGADMVEPHSDYTFYGYVHAHPKSGRATFLAEKVTPIIDDIKSFKMTAEGKERLQKFKVESTT